jgi:hypothetical protein
VLSEQDHRIFAYEGPVSLRGAFIHDEGRERGLRTALQRYGDEIVDALTGPDHRGFALGLLGEWGCGKTSGMLMLLDLVAERLQAEVGDLKVTSLSSPQEPLARTIVVTDSAGDHFPVTSSVLRAPLSLSEGRHNDARLDLAQAVLLGLPPQMLEYVATLLDPKRKATGMEAPRQRLENAQFLRQALRLEEAQGTDVEQWVRDARIDYLTNGNGDSGDGPAFLQRNVHVVLLDDLDRAPMSYTAQILNAVRFWVDTEGMFFVIAASPGYLGEAALAAMPKGWVTGSPDESAKRAVQKFVHHELHVPMLLETTDHVARYWKELLAASSGGLAKARNGSEALIDDALSSNLPLGVLAPMLSPRVIDLSRSPTPLPREAKRCYNALVGELSGLQNSAGPQEIKRNVAALAWRDAWFNFVSPALTERKKPGDDDGPRERALRTGIGLAQMALRETPEGDLDAAVDRLQRLASDALFDLAKVPPTMLLYLASDPPFYWSPDLSVELDPMLARTGGRESHAGPTGFSARTGNGMAAESRLTDERPPESGDGVLPTLPGQFKFRDTRYLREASSIASDLAQAAAARDVDASRNLAEQFKQVLAHLDLPADAKPTAPTIGNAAIRIEPADTALAWELHSLAHFLDPEHANIRLNLAEFLLDYAQGDDAWAEVESQLDWVLANAPQERPDRQLALRARLARGRGDEALCIELVEQFLDWAGRPESTADDFAYAVRVLSQLKMRGRLETFIHDRLNRGLPDEQGTTYAYTLLRTLGDELIEEDGELESKGTDILRYLVAVEFCPDDQSVADVLNNLALIYNTRRDSRYMELAGLLWLHALQLAPEDQVIRQAYSRYIERRDVESARRLQLGQPLEIAQPAAGEVERLVSALPPRMSEGPYWWEVFRPQVPLQGFAELALPDLPQPSRSGE